MKGHPSYSRGFVRDLSERMYRLMLDRSCGKGTAKMTDDDIANGIMGHDGKPKMSIRARAGAYDKITRMYLEVMGVEEQ